ncbi:arylesterase [Sphingopyxis sp. Root214]|jgi:triacylglycerol lipase|uniref:alpha/beta hydrolase n=1 Tax=unclassified Sphingopyxis TaxID=2614943 RepID=UPI0006FAE633|nr:MULTISPECIES: alpha/beta hydrolase [unclassified Sphingopyxis]KQZ73993.1 arylesterase [Sphingopyxis sp. Root154]KRC08133.1 arylesterase [Sphingopyxis sp. Root214]
MDTRHLVDREIAPIIDLFPRVDLDSAPIAQIRAKAAETYSILPPPVIAPEKLLVPSIHGGSDITVFLYRPAATRPGYGAILHIHGGGMVMGSVEQMQAGPAALAAAAGVPVASVEYRLAPEHPFPAPQEDCHSALAWLAGQADAFGFDASRIIVAGESAGGGLAAALAIMARDLGGPAIAGQLLTYPMLDHRTGSDACPYKNPTTGEFIWTRASNRFGWAALQGDYTADDARRGWFSPSLAEDLSGLPPVYIATGSLDLFFDENLDYARRLVAAGVPVDLHSYAGAIHAFNAIPDAALSQRFNSGLLAAAAIMAGPSGG